ncbi:MAG: hypothetical protein F6J90_08735 [Moorea sp. SIOASIH]|nr:hypothetical protein [Moorena sp. SIOASIH]NEO36400.1 hypothetical protein [Moorena sp. SIOASIH]
MGILPARKSKERASKLGAIVPIVGWPVAKNAIGRWPRYANANLLHR